jgi:hypothetical protein
MIPALRKALLPAAILALVWAEVVTVTGGIDGQVAGIAIRARSASRPLLIGLVLLGLYVALNRDAIVRLSERIAVFFERAALPIAVATSITLSGLALQFNSFTAGGADSYGYVSEAHGWATGELPEPIPLPVVLPFPTGDMMQIPLGYHEGPRPHTMVPIYAPGLPLLMAIGTLVAGPCGPFLVVPVCAGVLVWVTFVLARRAAGPGAGAIAAIVVATAPVVLYQAMMPMSDVPAGVFWTAALAASLTGSRRFAAIAGLCTAVGLLIRPNLLPLVVVPALAAALGQRGPERWMRVGLVLAPVVVAQTFLSVLHTSWYGSPFASGYGRPADLYAFANVWPNLKLNAAWFLQSQSAWALVGLLAFLPIAWKHADRRAIIVAALAIAVTLAAYLAYGSFEVWWYLRFLLPAAGAAATLIAIGVMTLARVVPRPWGGLVACLTFGALLTTTLGFAWQEGVFGGLREGERRYIEIGEFVSRTLPAEAALLSVQHSGSLRFYGGRLTLRFDWIEKDGLSRALAEIERIGLHPYLVIDDFELPQFQSQFGLPVKTLPFPVVARERERGGTTVFDLGSHVVVGPPIALEPGSAARCAGPKLPLRVR